MGEWREAQLNWQSSFWEFRPQGLEFRFQLQSAMPLTGSESPGELKSPHLLTLVGELRAGQRHLLDRRGKAPILKAS